MNQATLRGVDLSKVDRKKLTKVIKSLPALKCDTSLDSMVACLADHLVKLHTANPEKLLRCDYCGGSSDLTFDVCPYCGKDDEAASAALAAETGAPAEKVSKDQLDSSLIPVAAPKPAPVVHEPELVTTKDLDDSITAIKAVQVAIVVNHWQLGRLLGESYDKGLHKLRLEPDGKPKFKNWSQWVEAEIKFSPAYAHQLIGVSRAFSEEDIKAVGVTKLRVLARIPDEAKRLSLLEKAKVELNGKPQLSVAAVKKEARDVIATVPRDPKRPGPKPKPPSPPVAEAAERMRAEGTVTVAVQLGEEEVSLFVRKPNRRPTRARNLAAGVYATEQLVNGVSVTYELINKGGWELRITRTREADAVDAPVTRTAVPASADSDEATVKSPARKRAPKSSIAGAA